MDAYYQATHGLRTLETLTERLKKARGNDALIDQIEPEFHRWAEWKKKELPLLRALLTESEARDLEERNQRLEQSVIKQLLEMRA